MKRARIMHDGGDGRSGLNDGGAAGWVVSRYWRYHRVRRYGGGGAVWDNVEVAQIQGCGMATVS